MNQLHNTASESATDKPPVTPSTPTTPNPKDSNSREKKEDTPLLEEDSVDADISTTGSKDKGLGKEGLAELKAELK